MSMQESGLTMADTYALKNVRSVTKDSFKEEGIYQDVGSVQSLDNEAPDNSVMNTGAKNSNETVTCASKPTNTTNPIAENYTSIKGDVSCKRFICILVTITLVTTIALVCLAVLFYKIAQPQQTSSIVLLQLEQINKSLTSIQNQISREENAAQSNNIQQLNTSIDMQLSTLHNRTLQLSDSNTMLQQQLTTLHNKTQQLSDSNTMLQQQLTTLHNKTQQLSDSNTMLQQQLTTLHNQTQQLNESNTMFCLQVSFPLTLHPPVLLCLPHPPQAIIGSGPPMALL